MKELLEMLPSDPMDIIIGAWIILIILALPSGYFYFRLLKKMKPKEKLFKFIMNLEGNFKEGGDDAGKN